MKELKEKIKQLIAPNGKNAITAQVLQNVLLEIVDELKAECDSLGTSVNELETNDKDQDKRLNTLINDVEDLGTQIGDIDTILTEIIGGE